MAQLTPHSFSHYLGPIGIFRCHLGLRMRQLLKKGGSTLDIFGHHSLYVGRKPLPLLKL